MPHAVGVADAKLLLLQLHCSNLWCSEVLGPQLGYAYSPFKHQDRIYGGRGYSPVERWWDSSLSSPFNEQGYRTCNGQVLVKTVHYSMVSVLPGARAQAPAAGLQGPL